LAGASAAVEGGEDEAVDQEAIRAARVEALVAARETLEAVLKLESQVNLHLQKQQYLGSHSYAAAADLATPLPIFR